MGKKSIPIFIVLWLILSFLVFYSFQLSEEKEKLQDIKKKTPSRINVRKHFHILAVIVFLPGLIWDKEMLMTAASCAIIVFIMLEVSKEILRICVHYPT